MEEEDDDEFFFLDAYVEEQDDDAAAARAKRVEAGTWDHERILKNYHDKQAKMEQELMKSWKTSLNLGPPDWEEESSAKGRRHFDACLGGPELASSANVVAVRIVKSAVGYPLHVYGHVFVRDQLDCKRVYIFHRDRDNAQNIKSKDEALSLTGPSRGFIVSSNLHFDVNLKNRSDDDNHDGDRASTNDIEIGKWCLNDQAVGTTNYPVVKNRLVTELFAVELTYTPMHHAVEAKVEVHVHEILRRRETPPTMEWIPFSKKRKEHSEFHGKISVGIDGIPEDIVLYDSKDNGTVILVGDRGLVQLTRSVLAIPVHRALLLKIVSRDGDVVSEICPRTSGRNAFGTCAGSYRMRCKFTWSALYSPNVDGPLMFPRSLY